MQPKHILQGLTIMPTKLFFAMLFFSVFCVSSALGCGCPSGSDDRTTTERMKAKVDGSAAAFTGKVIGFVFRKGEVDEEFAKLLAQAGKPDMEYENKFVVFEVQRWWAGQLTETVELITDEKRMADGIAGNSSCNYHFKEGETYMVFADKRGIHLATDSCAGTHPIKDIKSLVELIGEGKPPLKSEED
jgi:hypothetical protein